MPPGIAKRQGLRVRGHVVAPCARDVRKRLIRTRVRDDGSCWGHAVLACLGLCEHAKKPPFKFDYRRNATALDLQRDTALRARMHTLHGIGRHVLDTPTYDDNHEWLVGFGSYGGPKEYAALAQMLGVDIALWDEDDMDAESCALLKASGTEWPDHDGEEQPPVVSRWAAPSMTVVDVLKRMDKPEQRPLVHVAWSDTIDAHVEAYVENTLPVYEVPSWLQLCALA